MVREKDYGETFQVFVDEFIKGKGLIINCATPHF
jgi:hypothetical protein